MGAFTLVSSKVLAKYNPESGCKLLLVNATGPASYDDGGSVINLSTVAGSQVLSVTGTAQGTTGKVVHYVPDTGNAPATAKLVVDDGGTQETASANLSAVKFDLLVVCTDAG
jgi:hypothetical protein